MSMRAIAFVIVGLMLGGCMQETIEPASDANWTTRDKQLMKSLPYAQAVIPDDYRRHIVEFDRKVGEAIDIYVNDRLVARGEVVLVEDRLGVTMTEIIKAGQA